MSNFNVVKRHIFKSDLSTHINEPLKICVKDKTELRPWTSWFSWIDLTDPKMLFTLRLFLPQIKRLCIPMLIALQEQIRQIK